MNTVEFAIKDGVPHAIDFTNPAPDMDVNSLTPVYFEWAVKSMADLTIDLALGRRTQERDTYRWDALLRGDRDANPASTAAEIAVEAGATAVATPARRSRKKATE
jgi:hypothetical protein